MKTEIILFIGLAFGLSGCVSYEDNPFCTEYELMTFEELRESVKIDAPREIKEAGKIYKYQDLLLVNEPNIGIHVIDNKDKRDPIQRAFISLHGNVDIAVKDGFLYADSFMDLVVFDISDIDNIKVVKRVNDTFAYDKYQAMDRKGRYRCNFDTTEGVVGVKR